jgi:O-antigen ligase
MGAVTAEREPAPPGIGAALGALALGLALGALLYRVPAPLPLAISGGIGLLIMLALALARPNAAVALGFGLLGIVAIEPAPADGVFFVVMAVAFVSRRFRLRAVPVPVLAALGTFAALNLLSAVQVFDLERAASFFLITLFLAALGLWLCGYVVSRRRARLVLRGYLFAATTSAALGVLALFVPMPAAEVLTEGGRARGLFQDPNVFGPFLIPALLIVVEEIVKPRLLTSRLPTKLLMAAVLALGVLFCYSRGAWLNLAIGLFVMGATLSLRRGGARRALALGLVAGVAAAVVGATVVATGSGDFLAERAQPQTYDQHRFSGQRASLESAWTYPFGVGPGQFEGVAQISAHSTYARVLGEQGFPGLLVLLILFAYTLGSALRSAAAGRGTYGIGSAALQIGRAHV